MEMGLKLMSGPIHIYATQIKETHHFIIERCWMSCWDGWRCKRLSVGVDGGCVNERG